MFPLVQLGTEAWREEGAAQEPEAEPGPHGGAVASSLLWLLTHISLSSASL